MHLDLHVWRFDWAASRGGIARGLADLARRSEALGVRTLSVMDHYFQMESQAPATDPMLEAYTTLGFLAAATSRLRLRTLVSGVTYRHPGVLAKAVTTLDVLSEGRAELGLGAAWYEREHRGLGIPFPPLRERFERLEEALEICLALWSGKVGRYEGRHSVLEETLCSPLPISRPRPRILIGGGGERKTLRLVARHADACNLFGNPDMVARKLDVLRRHCADVGRDPNEIEVTVMHPAVAPGTSPSDLLRQAETFAAVGVTTLVASATGDDPAAWLESTFGPCMADWRAIEPRRL
jgi:F420-dependent oxidoreductase-like protein